MTKRPLLLGLSLVISLLWLGSASYLYIAQDTIIFRPDQEQKTPDQAGFSKAQIKKLTTPDGETLIAWWVAPASQRHPVFLYLHGNAGNVSSRIKRFSALTEEGNGLLAIDWRGYGGSSGSPSETGFHIDARTAFEWLVSKKTPLMRLVIFGESLGTSPAVKLASEVDAAALILEAPFPSLAKIGQDKYPFIPVSLLLNHSFRSSDWIKDVEEPVLILQGSNDTVIDPSYSEELFLKTGAPRERIIFKGEGHIITSNDKFKAAINGLLQREKILPQFQ